MIHAVVANHNTSPWTELLVRSLFARHRNLPIDLTIVDNASTDDMDGLRRATEQLGVPIVQSGFTTRTEHNSHGEILQRFVLDPARERASHLLFLDADVCFTRANTIQRLLDALDEDEAAFGAGPRMSWDGETELPADVAGNPALYTARLHPCCALVRNTPVFRGVVQEIGLSCATYLWADRTQYLDTFELMTMVMRTHGQHHVIADALVLHAFAVSYANDWGAMLPEKERRRDAWLARFRAGSG
jgi:hypothetical protein